MKRLSGKQRLVIALISLLITTVGGLGLIRYVQSQKDRLQAWRDHATAVKTHTLIIREYVDLTAIRQQPEQQRTGVTKLEAYHNALWVHTRLLEADGRALVEYTQASLIDSLRSSVGSLSTAVTVLGETNFFEKDADSRVAIANRQVAKYSTQTSLLSSRLIDILDQQHDRQQDIQYTLQAGILALWTLIVGAGFLAPLFTYRNRLLTLRKRQQTLMKLLDSLRDESAQSQQRIAELELGITYREQRLQVANNSVLAKNGELRKLRADVENTIHILAHDLFEPIQSIRLSAQGLREQGRDLANQDEWRSAMDVLDARIQKLEKLLKGIREFTTLSHVDVKQERIYLNPFISEVILNLNPTRTVHFDIQPDLPIVQTNRVALERVLGAVLHNAVKFADQDSPEVQIGFSQSEDHLIFTIHDNGEGIPEEEIARIFDILYTGNREDSRSGMGLGLTIAQKVIRDLGGTIQVTSDEKGTTCTLVWPLTV